jgi:RecB family exonuclease
MSSLQEIKYLSNHRIETFLSCQKKLEFYLDSNRADPEVVNGDLAPRTLGTVLHATLEEFFKQSDKSLEKLLALYDVSCKSACLTWKTFLDGQNMLRGWFGRSGDILKRNVFSVEEEFSLDIEGVPVVGVLDRVDKIDFRTADITDYKSGFVPMSKWEVEHSLQLGIYNLAMRQKHTWVKKVHTIYDFLRWARVSTEMSDEKLEGLKNYLKIMWARIRSCEKPAATVSSGCRWCDYRHKCETYQGFVVADKFIVPNIESENLAGILKELDLCKSRVDAYTTRKEEIEKWMKDEMVERDIEQFEHGGWVVQLGVQRRTSYDYESVRKIFEPLGLMDEVTRINKTEVDRQLQRLTLTEAQEQELITSSKSSFSQPSLIVKQKRGRKTKSFG